MLDKRQAIRKEQKETALASHKTNYTSLREKCGLSADNDKGALKDQNITLETFESSEKEEKEAEGKKLLLLEARFPLNYYLLL